MNESDDWIEEAEKLCEKLEKLHVKEEVGCKLNFDTVSSDEEEPEDEIKDPHEAELFELMCNPILPVQRTLDFNEGDSNSSTLPLASPLTRYQKASKISVSYSKSQGIAVDLQAVDVYPPQVFLNTWLALMNEKNKAWEGSNFSHIRVVSGQGILFSARYVSKDCIHLLPPILAPSNRAFRRFGSHRFIKLSIPNKEISESFLERMFQTGPIEIADREYRYLHFKPGGQNITVYLFAERSSNPLDPLQDIPVDWVRKWHIPPEDNPSISLAKYSARFDLAFSATIGTFALDAQGWKTNCVTISDIISPAGQTMTDGCAGISKALMTTAWKSFVEQRSDKNLDENDIPTAVQARFGPFKGVWIINPTIKGIGMTVRPSMKKYTLMNPDQSQRTMEIREYSRYRGAGRLNRQLLVLLQVLLKDIEPLVSILRQEFQLILSVETNQDDAVHFLERDPFDPDNMKALEMIRSQLWDEPYLHQLIRDARQRYINAIMTKSHICVQKSSRFLLIADPSGLLQEGEAFLQTSHEEITGPILLARNPCYHPGDVRKLTAVDLPLEWKSVLKNVIVLSTQGERSVANMMSGGDYDGDEAWVCWDPRLVNACHCHPPATFTKETRRKGSTSAIPLAHVDGNLPPLRRILRHLFTLKESRRDFGVLSNWHLLRADWSPSGALDRGCLEMAELLNTLIDSSKTGIRVPLPIEYRECLYPEWWPNSVRNIRKSSSIIAQLQDVAQEQVQMISKDLHCALWKKHAPIKRFRDIDIDPSCLSEAQSILVKYEQEFVHVINQSAHVRKTLLGKDISGASCCKELIRS